MNKINYGKQNINSEDIGQTKNLGLWYFLIWQIAWSNKEAKTQKAKQPQLLAETTKGQSIDPLEVFPQH